MNSDQFRRYLIGRGCTIEHRARHDIAHFGERSAALPLHGGRKQFGTGLMRAIEKELGLD